jgi:hypothetical protein
MLALSREASYSGGMSRRRSLIARTVVALLLVGLAVIVFTTWRPAPFLKLEYEEFVGFDETQGLFYSTSKPAKSQELHCYDLSTGIKLSTIAMNLPVVHEKASNNWNCQLSADKRHLIAAVGFMTQVPILRMPDLKPVHFDHEGLFQDHRWAMGLSRDGKTLSLLSVKGYQNHIQIIDLDWESIQEITIPVQKDDSIGYGNAPPDLAIDITPDRRYVAFYSSDDEHIVYDLEENEEVIRVKAEGWFARFSTDGQRLVFLPTAYGESHIVTWYELKDGKWRKANTKQLAIDSQESIAQITPHYMITARTEKRSLG